MQQIYQKCKGMNKTNISLLFGIFFSMSIFAQTEMPDSTDTYENSSNEEVDISCQIHDTSTNTGTHRTPPRIPIIYLNRREFSIVFDNTCYDCDMYLVDVTSNAVIYTYTIPSGFNTVFLPPYLSGEYELHIHRGNYCFSGWLDL